VLIDFICSVFLMTGGTVLHSAVAAGGLGHLSVGPIVGALRYLALGMICGSPFMDAGIAD
jgi:hypothetical protein